MPRRPALSEGWSKPSPFAAQSRMPVWIRKFTGFTEEAEADREFWAQMTPDERVAVVEQMRREWWISNGQPDEGLRKVVRVLRTPQR